MPVIDVWGARLDRDLPPEVLARLLDRQRTARAGRDPGQCPEEDRPHLAKHIIHSCQAHDERVLLRGGKEWAHLSGGQPCPPNEVTW